VSIVVFCCIVVFIMFSVVFMVCAYCDLSVMLLVLFCLHVFIVCVVWIFDILCSTCICVL